MIKIFCDGASRGNPGPSSIGVSAMQEEREIFTLSEKLGIATNNQAEWTSLLRALETAQRQGFTEIQVFMDSELVVKQMLGLYKVKKPELKNIKDEVDKLAGALKKFQIAHIPRNKNGRADELANLAFEKP